MSIKISQLTAKGANLASTDLLEISEVTADGYASKHVTGSEVISAAQTGMQSQLISGTNIKTLEGQSLLGSGNIDLTKSDVGLSNVDNTSDLSKPISTATQTALNAKQDTLVSGTNIKTINGNSLLGSGDLVISTGLTIGTTAITLGTIGRILFEGTGNVVQESANLFWDNTNGRLGIGQSTPTARIHIQGSSALSANSSLVVFNSTPTEIFRIRDNGNVQIGALTDAGFRLDVNGTARVVNNILSGNGTYFTTGSQSIASASTSNAYVEISSGASSSGSLVWSKAGSLSTLWQLYSDSSNNIAFFRNGVNREIFKIFESTKNVGIDENSGTASFADITSAKLFVNSTTKGFLPPRMTTTQRNAIASPASGLIVYDTTDNKHYGYNGTAWTAFY